LHAKGACVTPNKKKRKKERKTERKKPWNKNNSLDLGTFLIRIQVQEFVFS